MIRRRNQPKWVHAFLDGRGKLRLYLRRPGFQRVSLPGPLWSPAFMQAYEAALASQKREPIGARRTQPGTISGLIVAYYASTNYTGLAATTQVAYRRVVENFRREFGAGLVVGLKREHVRSLLEQKAKTPTAANDWLKKIRILMRFAVDRGLRDDDPTSLVRPIRIKSDGHRTWSEADIAQFQAAHPLGSNSRLALELLLNTGQRRSDVVRMGRQHIRGGMISVRQQKTGQRLDIPIHRDLDAAIAATPPDQMTFLVGRYGKPYTPDGFGNWFNDACKAAGLDVGLTPHGLRKAMCVRLAEAGCSASQIMSISGHRNIREVETYVAAANQKKLASDAMTLLEIGNSNQTVANPGRNPLK
jgi:integrase